MNIFFGIFSLAFIFLVSSVCATTKPTLEEIKRNRLEYFNSCMGRPDAFALLFGGVNDERLDPEAIDYCMKKMEELNPIPPAVSAEKIIRDCMAEHGIPTRYEAPDYEPTPELTETVMNCIYNASKYQPLKYD